MTEIATNEKIATTRKITTIIASMIHTPSP